MSVTQTTRLNVYRWSSGADSFTRSQLDTSHAQIEALAAGFLQAATRPAAGAAYLGFIFYNTSTQALSYCDGSAWIGLNSFGSPSTQSFDDSAQDGSATTVARSDHKHGFAGFGSPVDVSTSNQDGSSPSVARSDHQHKLADLVISGGAIQDNSVDTPQIVDGAITKLKMAGNAVGAAQIETNAVGSSELADNSVADNHLQANSVGASEIKNSSVGTTQVSSIDASKITGTVSSSPNISANQVVSDTLDLGRIPDIPSWKVTGTFPSTQLGYIPGWQINGTLSAGVIPNLPATKITSGDLPDGRAPERIKTTFAGVERSSRIYVNDASPTGGNAYDIWIEY